jgi:Flp pilus assembly protein TadG
MQRLTKLVQGWKNDERGGIAIFGLYIFMTILIMAGLAIDMSHLVNDRTKLQIAADTAAHAALYNRDTKSADESKLAALAIANAAMPSRRYGDVLTLQDIHFGTYDSETQSFTVNENSRNAVLVTTNQLAARANPVSSFLLQLIGFAHWDVSVDSVFVTYRPTCLREGFVADGVVDIQSNNEYWNGFCIHSNDHVELNSNNTFQSGTIVSMPDEEDLVLPNTGFETNDGLREALREGSFEMRLVHKVPTIINKLAGLDEKYIPATINRTEIRRLNQNRIGSGELLPGYVYIASCSGGTLTIVSSTISNVVLLTTCAIRFSAGTIVEDSIIATTSTSDRSFYAPSDLQIGRDDGCTAGGGSKFLTLGGAQFAANLAVFGSQIVATKNIEFAARADGIKGASMIAGGLISGTSNMSMGFCGSNVDGYEAEYFRLAL